MSELRHALESGNPESLQSGASAFSKLHDEVYEYRRQTAQTKSEFVNNSLEIFDQLDKDKSGSLDFNELKAGLRDDKHRGSKAQTVAALFNGYDSLSSLVEEPRELPFESRHGVTRHDLSRFATLESSNSNNNSPKDSKGPDKATSVDRSSEQLENDKRAVRDVNDAITRTAMAQSSNASHELFADKTNPIASVTPDAVQKGLNGRGNLQSVLASLASNRPQDIVKMIQTNKDGTYTVTFPGAPDSPITVKAPTESEAGVYNPIGNYGTWANILEKASKECPRSWDTESMEDDLQLFTELLTGNTTGITRTKPEDLSKIAEELKSALTSKTPLVVSARGRFNPEPTSVLSFREDGNGGQFVTVSNHSGGPRQVKEMAVSEFSKTFEHCTIEGRDGRGWWERNWTRLVPRNRPMAVVNGFIK